MCIYCGGLTTRHNKWCSLWKQEDEPVLNPMKVEFLHHGGYARLHIEVDSESPILPMIARMLGYDAIEFIDYVDDDSRTETCPPIEHKMVPWVEPTQPFTTDRRMVRGFRTS